MSGAQSHPPPSVCAAARSLAAETYGLMGFAFAQPHREPDERAFTDHNLLWMSMVPGVQVRLFDQHQERHTGADFEWWIGDGRTYLPLLVQAKRLGRHGRYAALSGFKAGRQLNQLLTVCGDPNSPFFRYLPAYIFYNTLTEAGFPNDRCCGALSGLEERGCTMAHAVAVLAARSSEPRRGRTSISRVGCDTVPWGCLFCCPLRGVRNAGSWVQEIFENVGEPVTSELSDRTSQGQAALRSVSELPQYVVEMLDGDVFPAELDALDQIPGAGAVVVMSIGGRSRKRSTFPPPATGG